MGELEELYNLFCIKYYSGRDLIKSSDLVKHHKPIIRKYFDKLDDAIEYQAKDGNWIVEEANGRYAVYAGSEGHATVFKYGKEMKDHMEVNNGSTANYTGPVYSDWFYLDVDKRDDREGCIIATSPLLDYLKEKNIYHITASSGSKGLHIYIPIGYLDYPEEYSSKMHLVCASFANQLVKQFPTLGNVLDTQVYSKTHLLRMPFTLNYNAESPKLKRIVKWKGITDKPYPTWFTKIESNKANMTFIRETLASNYIVKEPHWKVDMVTKLAVIPKSKVAEKFTFPYDEKACIYKMMEDTNPDERHNTAMRIMMHWAEKGLPEKMVYDYLVHWRDNLGNIKDFPINDIAKNMKSFKKYTFNCSDPIKRKYCTKDNTCRYWEESVYEDKGLNSKNALVSYVKEQNSATDTYIYMEKIFEKMRFTVKPPRGYCMIIVGASGAGKTILAMNIMLRANHINWMFFSYEMSTNEIVSRFATMLSLNLDNQSDREKYYHLTKHIFIDDTMPPLQDQMKSKRACEARENVKIQAAVSDYLQIIPVLDRNDKNRYVTNPVSAAGEIARVAKPAAKEEQIAHFFLGQPTKDESGNANTELTEESVRDGQSYQAFADGIFALWRPHRNRKARANAKHKTPSGMMIDDVMTLSLVKWRHGQGDITYSYNFIPNKLAVQGLYDGTVDQKEKEKRR